MFVSKATVLIGGAALTSQNGAIAVFFNCHVNVAMMFLTSMSSVIEEKNVLKINSRTYH